MIDIHCHIIPDVDDGSDSYEESIEMVKAAAKEGVTKMIATPHIHDDSIGLDFLRLKTEELNMRLRKESVPVEIFFGGEVYADLSYEIFKKYSMNGNGYVLVEFPHSHLPARSYEILQNLVSRGLKPVIAHPERNPSVVNNPRLLIDLTQKTGAVVQVTASSIAGEFGRRIRMCSHYLLKNGAVDIIASDSHSMRFRMPGLMKGVKAAGKIIGREGAGRLVNENPFAVLNGETIVKRNDK